MIERKVKPVNAQPNLSAVHHRFVFNPSQKIQQSINGNYDLELGASSKAHVLSEPKKKRTPKRVLSLMPS